MVPTENDDDKNDYADVDDDEDYEWMTIMMMIIMEVMFFWCLKWGTVDVTKTDKFLEKFLRGIADFGQGFLSMKLKKFF